MGKLLNKVPMIAAGEANILALTGDGSVFSWGRETFGHLGAGSSEDKLSPVPVEFGDASSPTSSSISGESLRPKFVGIITGAYYNAL